MCSTAARAIRALRRMTLLLVLCAGAVIPATTAAAQQEPTGEQKTVAGCVTDAKGLPLAGVTILVKGTAKGTTTDAAGMYTLGATGEQTLQFSFLGYTAVEQTVASRTRIDVQLNEDAQLLADVVVVGYGVQKKSDLTGAVASIGADKLAERPQTNIIQALQGSIPGLNIAVTGSNAEGSSSETRIRGNNSITASNKPLIILDGIPFDGPWAEINASDVQSIEVLKDASSAAIYGARGANGVILVTTKQGETGSMTVSYDGFVEIDSPVNIPEMMNGEEFWFYKTQALEMENTVPPTGDNPQPWLAQMTATEERMHRDGRSTDWIDLATRTAVSHSHNLSFRGGVKDTKYYVSLNYTNREGIAVGDDFKRVNLRTNLTQKFTEWLTFSTNSQFGRYDRGGSEASFSRAFQMNPLAEAYNADGSIRSSAWENSSDAFCVNPLSDLNNRNSDIRYKLITNNAIDIRLPFVPGLSYKLNTGFTMENSSYKNYQGRDTYYGEKSNGILNTDDWNSTDWLIENILSYQRDFGKHRIFFTGLYSAQGYRKEGVTVEGKDFPNDVMYYYQASKAGTTKSTDTFTEQYHLSQMVRLNYSYDSRYLLTLTARRDGFSAFGKDSKFGTFPSVAVGWNLTNEPFYRDSKTSRILSTLKLRLSWGQNGNEAVTAYTTLPSLSTFNYISDDDKPMYGFYPQKLSSPALGWETTSSVNAGIDFALLNGRISGTFDIYWSRTKDLLLNRSIPSVNNTNNIIENIGKTANNGLEFQINSVNIQKKDFTWSTTLNFSRYRTKIKDVGLYDADGNPADDVASGWFIGQPVNSNYDYKFIGIWQITDPGNPEGPQVPGNTYSIPGYMKYADLDGKEGITSDDRTLIGSTIPKCAISMMNTFRYRGLSLSVFLNSSIGRTARNYLMDMVGNTYAQNKLMIEYWTPEHPIDSYPKNATDTSPNPKGAGFYQKTDFLRIQDVTLSYRLPERWMRHIGMKRFEVYMNIKNLATWTSWDGLDPEFVGSQRATPTSRGFIFGLKFDL